MVRMIMNWIAIVYLYVYILAWLSRWLGYDIMVMACRKQWRFMFFGMIMEGALDLFCCRSTMVRCMSCSCGSRDDLLVTITMPTSHA